MPAPNCTDMIDKLGTAINSLASGKQQTGINFGDRSVQYSQANLADLKKLFRQWYRICGADSGWPDLSGQAEVLRGPPARIPR